MGDNRLVAFMIFYLLGFFISSRELRKRKEGVFIAGFRFV